MNKRKRKKRWKWWQHGVQISSNPLIRQRSSRIAKDEKPMDDVINKTRSQRIPNNLVIRVSGTKPPTVVRPTREWQQARSKGRIKVPSNGGTEIINKWPQQRGSHSDVDLGTIGETGRGLHWSEQGHWRKVDWCWDSWPWGLSGIPRGAPCQSGRAPCSRERAESPSRSEQNTWA